MRAYLIRHGRSQDAEAGLTQRKESPLSKIGRQSLASLKPEFQKIPFSMIYHSPWNRAKETAQLLFSDLQISFKEISYIHERKNPSHLEGVDPSLVKSFWNDNLDNIYKPDWRPDDGESFTDILKRVKKLKKLLLSHNDDETIGVVSHGVIFRYLVGYWLMGNQYSLFIFNNLLRHIRLDNLGYIIIDINKEKETIRVEKWHNFETK